MNQALAVLWAQWRSYRNAGRGQHGLVWLSYIFAGIWYLGWLAAGVAVGFVLARPGADELTTAIAGALLLMSMYWQGIPMMLAAAGFSIDLQKIKMYPIPTKHLFGIEVLLRITAALEMFVVLIGAAAGLLFNPVLSGWRALGAIPFALFHMLLALGLRDYVVRILGTRRIRQFAALFFVALITVPRVLFRRGSPARAWVTRQFQQGSDSDFSLFPWVATAQILTGTHPWRGALVMLGWCAVAAAFAAWQFNRTLRFDPDAALSAGSGEQKPAQVGGWQQWLTLPSQLFGDSLGNLIEKEFRYLLRAARFRMLFLISSAMGLIMAQAFSRSPSGANFLGISGGYTLLLMGEVCIWNTFGFDRSAAQLYFVAPVRIARVLIAKNVTAMFFILLAVSMTALLASALQFSVTPKSYAEGLAVTFVSAIYLFSAGNFASFSSARPVDPESSMRSRAAGGKQMLLMFLYPIVFIPAGLAYLARWIFDTDTAFYSVLGIMAALGALVYGVALDSVSNFADRHKEKMVAALSAGQGPVSS